MLSAAQTPAAEPTTGREPMPRTEKSGTNDEAEANGRDTARQSLDNGWEYYQGSLGSVWEIWRGDKATDNVTWKEVTLPHCFNGRDSVDPDTRYYQGPGWYRSRLKVSNPYPGGRTLLHFNGAGQKTEVYVGLQKIAVHNGGYDEWDVDITEAAAKELAETGGKGEIRVSVRCDNSRDAESIPSDLSDFNRYGGIYRHLYLVYVPRVSVEGVHVDPELQLPHDKSGEDRATISIRARLYDPDEAKEPLKLILEVKDPDGKVIHSNTVSSAVWKGEKEIDSFVITAPKLWSPRSPSLYRCSLSIGSPDGEQKTSARFGIRSAEWAEHGPFLLNGERLPLRGTHYHEDHAGVAAAVPDTVVRQTLVAIKEMGANFVRLGHYQQAPLVLDLCDELGLLVWEEVPWCRGGIGGEGYRKQARDMLGAMIDQHDNHPSVILWGLGNENDWDGDFPVYDKEAIRKFMREQNDLAHRLDRSRKTVIRRCDFCKDLVDVYSPSIWAGWYSGRYSEYRAALDNWIKQVPHFLHAEYGGDSHARRHSEDPEKFLTTVGTGMGTAEVGSAYKGTGGAARPSKDGDWSESYIINLFDWHLMEQERTPDLTGAAQWIFKDFATPLRPENPVPRVNQKGVVERDGTPKESYYVFQSHWSDKPMIHIYGHTWPVRWGKKGEEKQVKVFSNCPEAELFVNGVSAGVRKRDAASFPASGLVWNVNLNPGGNTLRAVGRKDGLTVTDEIRQDYQTDIWEKPDHLTLHEVSHSDGMVTVEVTARDRKGILCLDATNVVRFGIAGDGILIDNLGTSTGSRIVQLYNGRARIGIRETGPQAVATVSAKGLPTAYLNMLLRKDEITPKPSHPESGPVTSP
jgi:beta-galactosidase